MRSYTHRNGKDKMGKGDVKSIRLEEDHERYIQQYRGDNFNNKLENLIADSIDFEKARTKRISQLDQLISQKSTAASIINT